MSACQSMKKSVSMLRLELKMMIEMGRDKVNVCLARLKQLHMLGNIHVGKGGQHFSPQSP